MSAATPRHADSAHHGPDRRGQDRLWRCVSRPTYPIEIISVDSALVYRGMDIGTGKPSREQLERFPHHLVDILDPSQAYSAGQFVRDALQAIGDIRKRSGKLPVLVGGTMLYFRALRRGLRKCRKLIQRCDRKLTPKPARSAGRRYMRSWRRSIR